jgi:hypothetical protein
VAATDECYEYQSFVRGYHVYQAIWQPVVGEILFCHEEPDNQVDKNGVSVQKNDIVVVHVRQENAFVCKFFMQRGGSITVTVAENKVN